MNKERDIYIYFLAAIYSDIMHKKGKQKSYEISLEKFFRNL